MRCVVGESHVVALRRTRGRGEQIGQANERQDPWVCALAGPGGRGAGAVPGIGTASARRRYEV